MSKYKALPLRALPAEAYEKRKEEVKKIAKLYTKREGHAISGNLALNLLIAETAKKKSI